VDWTKFSTAFEPGPKGWRRIILPFRWFAYRLLRPLFVQQAKRYFELAAASAEMDRRREILAQEIARLRDELDDLKRTQARAGDEARKETTVLDQRVRQTLALGWDHVALVRRLASIEDHLNRLDSFGPQGMRGNGECTSTPAGPTVLLAPPAKSCG
jgi:hypothetical protein